MKRKTMFLIIGFIATYAIGFMTVPVIQKIRAKSLEEHILYNVIIDTKYINLRRYIDLSDDPIKEVYKNEKYPVVDYYEGNRFNWYKIIYEEGKTGWIASGKDESWVTVVYE